LAVAAVVVVVVVGLPHAAQAPVALLELAASMV
jgi:hypothetical protein